MRWYALNLLNPPEKLVINCWKIESSEGIVVAEYVCGEVRMLMFYRNSCLLSFLSEVQRKVYICKGSSVYVYLFENGKFGLVGCYEKG